MAFVGNMKGITRNQMYSIYNYREFLVPIDKERENGDSKQVYAIHQQQEEVKRDSNRYEFNTTNTDNSAGQG